MLSYVVGAALFGVTGLVLAIPAAALFRIWHSPHAKAR